MSDREKTQEELDYEEGQKDGSQCKTFGDAFRHDVLVGLHSEAYEKGFQHGAENQKIERDDEEEFDSSDNRDTVTSSTDSGDYGDDYSGSNGFSSSPGTEAETSGSPRKARSDPYEKIQGWSLLIRVFSTFVMFELVLCITFPEIADGVRQVAWSYLGLHVPLLAFMAMCEDSYLRRLYRLANRAMVVLFVISFFKVSGLIHSIGL